YYLLNEAKNPIEIKKLFYLVPGDEGEKEKDLTFLYALSLISIVKEGERLNPFEEVLKLAKEKERMNFYELLGVKEDATEEEIRKAYFEAAKKFHPDKFSSFPEFFNYRTVLEDFFATINQAYQILSNKEERKKYDTELKGEKKKEFDPKEKSRELLMEAKKAISAKQNSLAIQKLSEIIYLKQEDWKVLQLLGKLYIEENKLKEAENFLRKSLSIDDKQYETYNLLGDLYVKAGLKQRAIKEYQKAIELNPANMEAKEKLDELL
ncbi:MAG: DnaJ domain-containing protein, partial [Thermoanaerobaculia bacterium]